MAPRRTPFHRGKRAAGQAIEPIAFAPSRQTPVEVLTLRSLHARRPRDLTAPERPDFNLVFLITHATGWHVVDFVRHALRAGQVLTVGAGQVQQFAPSGALDALMLVFKPDATRWKPPRQARVLTPSPQRLALLHALFAGIQAELGADGGQSGAVAAHLVECVGAALSDDAPTAQSPALVNRFQHALEHNFRRAHEVAAYAAILRCTTKTLVRQCLAATGLPPKRTIDERLVLEARRCLAHEEATIHALSEALGFATPSHFVKFFRRMTGETPLAFRTRIRSAR